jgi:hypothetical protein
MTGGLSVFEGGRARFAGGDAPRVADTVEEWLEDLSYNDRGKNSQQV